MVIFSRQENSDKITMTHSNRVLHISDRRLELAKVKFWSEDDRKDHVAAREASSNSTGLPLSIIGEKSSVVLSSCYTEIYSLIFVVFKCMKCLRTRANGHHMETLN